MSLAIILPGAAAPSLRVSRPIVSTLVALSLAIVLGALASYSNVGRLMTAAAWVSHTLQVRAELRTMLSAVLDSETAQRGYTLSANSVYLDRFEQAVAQTVRASNAVRELTRDNADQQRRLEELDRRITDKLSWSRRVIREQQERGASAAIQLVATGRGLELTDAVRQAISEMEDEENMLLAARNKEQAASLQATIAGFAAFAGVSILLALLVWHVMRRDLANRRAAEQRLLVHTKAIESSVNGIFITSVNEPDNPTIFVNPAVERISGYPASEMIGRNCRFLQKDDRQQPALAEVRLALKEGRACRVVLRNYRKDGSLFWNDLTIAPVSGDGNSITHHIGVLHDITEQVAFQEELKYKANFDTLTGLPNRNLLIDRLRGALVAAAAADRKVAAAVINIDNFRYVNDSLGHETGDRLLKEMARRLQWITAPEDTLARYTGDQFVLISTRHNDAEELGTVLDGFLSTVAQHVEIDEHELLLTCSIGVSVFPADAADADTLLRNADLAMYRAKAAGRNRFEFFVPDLTKRARERLLLERGLRRALERGEFVLHYQPQIDLRGGNIVGAEALIRWAHPENGMIPPGRFIPVAEDAGLIIAIGEWVLREACIQCKVWHDQGYSSMRVSVNLSATHFLEKDFVPFVMRILEETGLSPTALELEVTESLLMSGADDVLAILSRVKTLGIELAIDDFGTGFSSLSYLKRLPVDRLKIDQSFVRALPDDTDDAAICRSVIALGSAMSLSVIAEGIETAEQRDFLRELGCHEGQGYLFSRPVAAAQYTQLLAAHFSNRGL